MTDGHNLAPSRGAIDAKLRAIDVKTGDEKFAADMGALSAGSPAVLDDRIIMGTDGGRIVCLADQSETAADADNRQIIVRDREFEESHAILKTLRASHALGEGDLETFDRIARAAVEGDPRWFVLGDANHQQLINTHFPSGHAAKS